MKDNEKTRDQLVPELSELRSQNSELKKSIIVNTSAEVVAEEARRYAESIVETVREPLLVLDADLKIISANRYFYTTFKVIPGETIGSYIYDLGNKQWDIPQLRELLEEVLPEKQAFDDFEVNHDFQDIGHKIMLLNACRIYRKDISANMILLAIEDITERKRLEDLLTESEERYRRLFETASDGIVLLEKREGKITHANPATEKMLGYTNKDSIGNRLQDIGISLDMDDFQSTMQKVNTIGIVNYNNVPVKTKSGQHIDTDIYLVDRARLAQCNIRDITERKKAENEQAKLESQLRQAQKMESVARLAGGVAHDFNNMLGVIIGRTEIALEQMDPSNPLHTDLTEILKAANRSADLTNQLLAFARKQTIAPKVLDLNEAVEGMLKMLRRLIGEHIDIAWLPGASMWPVKVDPSQIDQILANLCVNARDAISDVGKITIETGTDTFDEDDCTLHAGFSPGDYVLLIVSDDGCGMDKETLSHLFEPFFTTKAVGKGTGLGLATVYGIVKQNNGFINVYSEPNQGTTFKIYLRRHAGKAEQARTKGLEEAASRGQETILLAEDEPAILELTTMLLKRQGYTVVAASTPGEAIRLAREYPGEIHLLMTDVVMPEMNGRDLAKNLLILYPHLKRLFTSGYTADVIAHHGVLDEGVHFIQKPFSIKSLAAKVREVLDQK